MSARNWARQGGFTVLELVVTIAMIAVLVAIGIPTFDRMLTNSRLTASSNALVSSLQYARAEAVKYGDGVTICATADGIICANTNDWSIGWMVFTDADGNAGELDGSDVMLRYVSEDTAGITVIIGGLTRIRYLADGSIDPGVN